MQASSKAQWISMIYLQWVLLRDPTDARSSGRMVPATQKLRFAPKCREKQDQSYWHSVNMSQSPPIAADTSLQRLWLFPLIVKHGSRSAWAWNPPTWRGAATVCCSAAQLCPTLCDPMDCSTPGLPCPSPSPWSLLKLMSIESVMPSNHLILCHPLLLQPSVFPGMPPWPEMNPFRALTFWPQLWPPNQASF